MILYLHGFTSGPQSRKAAMLAQRMAARGLADRFVCPQLPHSPRQAIALCEDIITARVPPAASNQSGFANGVADYRRPVVGAGDTVTLVGSSLGGYYATWLAERHNLRAVLVNPAVVAHLSPEKFVGPQHSLYTGEAFDFTREHIEELRALDVPQLAHPENFWLLVETGDEVLDYRQAVEKYRGARQTVLAGGDHGFTRWTDWLDDIIAFAGLS